MASFLQLPTELRLHIYGHVLAEHQLVHRQQPQPSNAHLRLLHTCRRIADEADNTFRRYVSLLHERQIRAFLLCASPSFISRIEWADVANDGRVFHSANEDQEDTAPDTPLSSLHIALGRMALLRRLRVFPCRQGLPISLHNMMSLHRSRRLGLRFERAMFPKLHTRLSSYELYLDPNTRIDIFDVIIPDSIVTLRLSGEITAPRVPHEASRMPCLRHVTLYGITGNYFDRHTLDECFPDARLDSFTYALGHRLGFEIRNYHLQSLAVSYSNTIRKLVLLGCSRLSSTAITHCLESLNVLEYFALHLVTVGELRSNFVNALSPCLFTLKLQVINAWYAIALKDEERRLCDSIESQLLLRDKPPQTVDVCFRAQLMIEGARQQRWAQLANNRNIDLRFGPWADDIEDV